MSLDTTRPAADGLDPTDDPAEAPRPANTFEFEGVEIQVVRYGSNWHVYAAGQEAISPHLGEATRILFNPRFHGDTTRLIHEILDWWDAAHQSKSV